MKLFNLTYFLVLITTFCYSQPDREIIEFEKQKIKIQLEIKKLTDSINAIDIKIVQLKSREFLKKIKDSSLIAIARKGAKLKKDSNVFADIITTFTEDKEVIILDYKNGYYQICHGSICGYMSEIWTRKNNSLSEFVDSKQALKKTTSSNENTSSSYSSSTGVSKSKKSSYRTKGYRSSRTYYKGPRGGCYYINLNGNKTYVARSLCN